MNPKYKSIKLLTICLERKLGMIIFDELFRLLMAQRDRRIICLLSLLTFKTQKNVIKMKS